MASEMLPIMGVGEIRGVSESRSLFNKNDSSVWYKDSKNKLILGKKGSEAKNWKP